MTYRLRCEGHRARIMVRSQITKWIRRRDKKEFLRLIRLIPVSHHKMLPSKGG